MAPHSRQSPGFVQLRHEAMTRLFSDFSVARVVAATLAIVVTLAVSIADGARFRLVGLAILGAAGLTWALLEQRRFRRRGAVDPRDVSRNIGGVALMQLAVVFLLGGIESPLLPFMAAVALIVGLLATRRTSTLLVALQMTAIWGFAWLRIRGVTPNLVPSVFGGEIHAPTDPARFYATATFMSVVLPASRAIGARIRASMDEGIDATITARDEALAAYGEQMRELTAFSAEIAHELKNPLASVKGLAALVSRELDGKAGERMGVLRREVDRMQGILEELLDYTRPVVPLSCERSDLRALAEEVATLHEAMARDRGLRLAVSAPAEVTVVCDPRKVKQILVNLVQNAVHASPPESAIEIAVAPAEHGASIAVLDRGPGLDASVAGRVFEAGVTTKPQGSGLGLTVARAIARQHGGELTLDPRDGGGLAARLTLPRSAAPGEAS
ncbi:MAG: HAMP domain-containing sensor histidine kinase [Byssovorax sp.]